jgi:hypothetical protein
MSRRYVLTLGLVCGLVSVALATIVSVAARELYLPVQADAGPVGFVFLLAPVLATATLGVRGAQSRGFIAVAAFVVAAFVVALSLVAWIGWIVVDCGVNLERCVE